MICPNCGSYKVSERVDDKKTMYGYLCLECYEGFNEGDYKMPLEIKETIHMYTDGACSNNPGPAGIGVLLRHKNHERRISKFLGNQTNNIAELMAIKIGLEAIVGRVKSVVIYSDSQYSIGILSNPTWKPKANIELVKQIKKIMKEFVDIKFVKVKGHSDHPENTITDKLAVQAYLNRKDSDERGVISS